MDGSDYHIIAYSGGVDSALVAALVHNSATSEESIRAVLGLSPAVPSDQVALAEHVAHVIGVTLEQIPTTEGTDATYIENSGQFNLIVGVTLILKFEALSTRPNAAKV